jgi:DNA-binding NarL/FixJ family response regulator
VLIVDDHAMLREGTERILADVPDVEVIGTAGDGRTALSALAENVPDVLLLDLRLPNMSGIAVARRVRQAYPNVAIIALSGYDNAGFARALAQMGARGYLRKTASGSAVLSAIRAVVAGEPFVADQADREAADLPIEPLTPREHQVLQLLAAGWRNQEIAQALQVKLRTVEFHVSHVMEKLGARSRTEAGALARRYGLDGSAEVRVSRVDR